MTNQEYNQRLDEILDQLSDSSAARGWLDCKSGSEDTHPRNDLVDIAKQAITDLFLSIVGEDEKYETLEGEEPVAKFPEDDFIVTRNMLRSELRKSIAKIYGRGE